MAPAAALGLRNHGAEPPAAAWDDCQLPPEERAPAPAATSVEPVIPEAKGDRAASKGGAGCGYCRHKVFGRGKIVKELPPDKVQVNFPGFGLKVILREYLLLEG